MPLFPTSILFIIVNDILGLFNELKSIIYS